MKLPALKLPQSNSGNKLFKKQSTTTSTEKSEIDPYTLYYHRSHHHVDPSTIDNQNDNIGGGADDQDDHIEDAQHLPYPSRTRALTSTPCSPDDDNNNNENQMKNENRQTLLLNNNNYNNNNNRSNDDDKDGMKKLIQSHYHVSPEWTSNGQSMSIRSLTLSVDLNDFVVDDYFDTGTTSSDATTIAKTATETTETIASKNQKMEKETSSSSSVIVSLMYSEPLLIQLMNESEEVMSTIRASKKKMTTLSQLVHSRRWIQSLASYSCNETATTSGSNSSSSGTASPPRKDDLLKSREFTCIIWQQLSELHRLVHDLPPNCYQLFLKKKLKFHLHQSMNTPTTPTMTNEDANNDTILSDTCDVMNDNRNSREGIVGIEENGETIFAHDSINQILADVPRSKLGTGFVDEYEAALTGDQVLIERTKLFNVLYSVCMFYPTIGYCQGMSYICTMLLRVMDQSEELTFFMMLNLIDKYDLRALFVPSFPLLKKIQFVFESLMLKRHSKLWNHLSNMGVSSELFIPKWILPMFCLDFPQDFVLRVWDCFLLDGWKSIYQVLCSILVHNQSTLFGCKDPAKIIFVLQELPLSLTRTEDQCKVFEACPKMFKDRDLTSALSKYDKMFQQKRRSKVRSLLM